MGRVDVLAGAVHLQRDDIGVLEPSAQNLARRERSNEDRGLGAQRAGQVGVAQDQVVSGDETPAASEVTAQGARAIGEDGPAGQLGELQQAIRELLAVGRRMGSDHDDPAVGLREQGGHGGRGEQRVYLGTDG